MPWKENTYTNVFEWEVSIYEEKMLSSQAPQACKKAFKEWKELPSSCQIDRVIALKRADGEPFPENMFAIRENETGVLYAWCILNDDIVLTSYGTYTPQIDTSDKAKILNTLGKDTLFVKITRDDYQAYEPKNPHCAVFWNKLEIEEKPTTMEKDSQEQ